MQRVKAKKQEENNSLQGGWALSKDVFGYFQKPLLQLILRASILSRY